MSVGCNDPNCSYRALYEGSQLSLSESAGNSAAMFNRVNDLRNAVILQMKRTFPRLFTAAETQNHQRMSNQPDQVILAFLESFLGTVQIRTPRPEGIEDLRAALDKWGIAIPDGLELHQWASVVNNHAKTAAIPAPVTPPTSATVPSSTSENDSLEDLFGESEWHTDDDWIANEDPYEHHVEPPQTAPDAVDDDLTGLFSDDEPSEVVPLADEVVTKWSGVPSLRPEMPHVVPATKPVPRAARQSPAARPKKAVRAKALSPDPLLFDVIAETPTLDANGELTDAMRNALVAATCIPRPVFLADLEAITKSRDILEAWEREGWADPQVPVGFISAKPRHRARGSLVLPKEYAEHAAPEFSRSLWAACIRNQLHGARIYEAGVLLHRVGDEVTNWQFSTGNRTLRLTLAQRRGLVGLVVVFEQKKELIREALVADLEALFAQRPVLASVLVTHDPSYEAIRSIIIEEAEARRWAPPFPVTMTRSWEFGQPGATADLVLGD
jgi:hypothetical protein